MMKHTALVGRPFQNVLDLSDENNPFRGVPSVRASQEDFLGRVACEESLTMWFGCHFCSGLSVEAAREFQRIGNHWCRLFYHLHLDPSSMESETFHYLKRVLVDYKEIYNLQIFDNMLGPDGENR